MTRPRYKGYGKTLSEGEVRIVRETGTEFRLAGDASPVLDLLDLLDGSRTTDDACRALTRVWPDVSIEEVSDTIAVLDAAGLLEDADAPTSLSARQQERYFSNLAFFSTFADLGHSRYAFQERLRRSRVVLLGVGGLGSTLLFNLAGLGVGHVTVLDADRVELRNLARQYLYSESDIGCPKLARAVARIQSFNSELEIVPVERRVCSPDEVAALLPGADLVLSAIDQPAEVQKWVNQACVEARVPFITGGMQVAHGLYYSVQPGQSGCLACWQTVAGPTTEQRPAQRINRGLGPVASLMGSLIALEAVRYLTGFAPPVSSSKLWLVDFATGEVQLAYQWSRVPECPICGIDAEARP